MNHPPVLSDDSPWPKREAPASFVETVRTYKPELDDDTLKFDPLLVARLEEKLAYAKQQLNTYAKRAEERKNAEILEAQLRQNELDDIVRFEKALAKLYSVRPASP